MTYARPADRAGALRLHLNENTGGCSAQVLDAIRQISVEEVAIVDRLQADPAGEEGRGVGGVVRLLA